MYTTKDSVLSENIREFLTNGYDKNGLNCKMMDQSTYGTKNKRDLDSFLEYLETRINEMSKNNKLSFDKEDYVRVVCSAIKADDVENGRFLYQYNIVLQ